MEIRIKDSFIDSLKTLKTQNTWWYKTYELFRYDIPRFIKNIWLFRKALWNHRWWDHHSTLDFMSTSFIHMSDNVEKYGYEVDESRLKKVEKMRRAAQLIKNYNEDRYIDMAEAELGPLFLGEFKFEQLPDQPDLYQMVDNKTEEEQEHNSKVFKRAREIEEQEWEELITILKGQDYSKFDENKDFDEQFDGSGIRGWWD